MATDFKARVSRIRDEEGRLPLSLPCTTWMLGKMSAVFSDAEESLGTGMDRQVNKLTGQLAYTDLLTQLIIRFGGDGMTILS